MITEKMFQEKLSECKRKIEAEGIRLIGERKMLYGIQLLAESKYYEMLKINIYLSKQGISYVISDKKTSISSRLDQILTETFQQIPKVEVCYLGTDESGKGDYFGPLVAAGFLSYGELDAYLIKHEIQDCKKMSDQKVKDCAKYLMSNFSKNCIILTITPKKYNELYRYCMIEGKTLNDLLALAHSRVISAALEKKPKMRMLITDQFTDKELLIRQIEQTKPDDLFFKRLKNKELKTEIQVLLKAEKYTAVAAASILARAAYLEWIENMSDRFGLIFPKGCGEDVKFMAAALMDKVGERNLEEYVKIHFKTTDAVMKGYHVKSSWI